MARRLVNNLIKKIKLNKIKNQKTLEVEKMAECPECGADISLNKKTEKGEIVNCSDCGIELEVIGIAPFKLAPAPEEEEDWGE